MDIDQDSILILTCKQPSTTEDDVSTTNQACLPIEILDLIVDELASDARSHPASLEALRRVALVSLALCKRAYKHLFSELRLILVDSIFDGLAKSKEVISRLYDILLQGLRFPGIGMVHYIRTLQISLAYNTTKQAALDAIALLSELPGILDCLHGVDHGITCLKLDLDPSYDPSTLIRISKRINPKLFDSFISLCSSPKFTTLYLANIGLDSKSLCGTNVQNLHLNNFSFEDEESSGYAHNNDVQHIKAILQPVSLSLLNINAPKPNSVVPTEIFADLASFLHPSPNNTIDKSLDRQLVYAKLTTLVLQDRDRITQINLLPRIHTLKVIQTIYLTRRHMSYTTGLPQFFVPLPDGMGRDLGCVKELVVETIIPDPRLFFCPGDDEEPRLEDAWSAVDAHLTSASPSSGTGTSASATATTTSLQRVHFDFFLRAMSNGFPLKHYPTQRTAMETYKHEFLAKFFPRLFTSSSSSSSSFERSSSFPAFSAEVSIQIDDNEGVKVDESVVKYKGSETGWW